MSNPSFGQVVDSQGTTPSTSNRVLQALALRTQTAVSDAALGAPAQVDNGDEARYADKCGTYSKGILQTAIGFVDLAAYQSFKTALNSGNPADFEAIVLGGPRKQNGPQGGLAFELACPDNSQYTAAPAPILASEEYATELVELYWASLLRDVAFSDFASNVTAIAAAKELSTLPTYQGPRDASGKITPDLLFRGAYAGETVGPYLSQFLMQDTCMGALPITQQYTAFQAGIDFMTDPTSFQQVQNGIATGKSLTATAPVYLHNGRGLAAYTHNDVLYQAYFTAFLVLRSINGIASRLLIIPLP